ncbi:hypothetical protein BJ322DRAFT_885790 [Thelephora terrestris]|uniref:Secreted protein n=1 Tax=Thelephora terrestris TaxID=56493 RepID=A0A9P6HDP3_9AGAM|nr:hypothetical protein BJ322DRAFT_885790 [Thelephora terrestris]
MIFSVAVAVSVLSLFTFTRAATIYARGGSCAFVCPDKDLDGDPLLASTTGVILSCSYTGESPKWCTYNSSTGVFVGDENCPKQAVKKCVGSKNRELKQAMVRRGAHDEHENKEGKVTGHKVEWERRGSPSPGPKRDVPSSTADWSWPSHSPSPWEGPYGTPSPSKPKPSPPPSTQQPCNFRCPEQDLANDPLTDEAIRGPYLFCSYSTSECDTCSFCKYGTKTGGLLEDSDDGNCPQKAPAARPWDRRFV